MFRSEMKKHKNADSFGGSMQEQRQRPSEKPLLSRNNLPAQPKSVDWLRKAPKQGLASPRMRKVTRPKVLGDSSGGLMVTRPEVLVTRLEAMWTRLEPRIASADALPTIGLAEAPLSHNHVKSPQTQDNSTKDDPSDIGSKLDPKGVAKGRDATMNKLNEDADPNEGFQMVGLMMMIVIIKLLTTMLRVLVG
ncbi:hypothetical protein Tco_1465171 [Tanacetum coccineum]